MAKVRFLTTVYDRGLPKFKKGETYDLEGVELAAAKRRGQAVDVKEEGDKSSDKASSGKADKASSAGEKSSGKSEGKKSGDGKKAE